MYAQRARARTGIASGRVAEPNSPDREGADAHSPAGGGLLASQPSPSPEAMNDGSNKIGRQVSELHRIAPFLRIQDAHFLAWPPKWRQNLVVPLSKAGD